MVLQDLPDTLRDILLRCKKDKGWSNAYSNDVQTFAKRLHSYSDVAYNFVRSEFMNFLPSVSSVKRWITKDGAGEPGLQREVIEKVSAMVGKKLGLRFGLSFDERFLRKMDKKNWVPNTNKWQGVAESGGDLNDLTKDGEHKVAGKCLVFMLTCFNQRFKVPVACYLIDSLDGQTKVGLVNKILIELESKLIKVRGLTFDGDAAHITTCNVLGANFYLGDGFKNYLNHPSSAEPVYIFFYPCHMLKLFRNYFASKKIFYDPNGKVLADWNLISNLHKVQSDLGLNYINKLSDQNIAFHHEKMKVCLAAQMLSRSVSAALKTAMRNNLQGFEDIYSTAEFCRVINDIFDFLNDKKKYHPQPCRKSVDKNNLDFLKKQIDYFINYIKKLEYDATKKVYRSEKNKADAPSEVLYDKKKDNFFWYQIIRTRVLDSRSTGTGFLGLVVSFQSLLDLGKSLREVDGLKFFLSFKISQDHVELFFLPCVI